jgi:ABC-2 type transport system ATP-binding protein
MTNIAPSSRIADGGNSERDGADDSRDEVAIRASGVEKAYDSLLPWEPRVEVLDGADLEISPGELVGIVGENGSGKSTLMQILVGALAPDAGAVERGGTVGWCPQEPLLYDRLTVRETMRLFGEAYGIEGDRLESRVAWLADRLDFERYLDTRIDRLSGGNRQKVNLSVALLHEPDVLLLDEPYTGFDWETYLAFWELTDELAADGTAIAIISHFVEDRDRFDAIYELRDGGLVEDGGSGDRGTGSSDGGGERSGADGAVPGGAGDAARADRTPEVGG